MHESEFVPFHFQQSEIHVLLLLEVRDFLTFISQLGEVGDGLLKCQESIEEGEHRCPSRAHKLYKLEIRNIELVANLLEVCSGLR